MKFGLTPGGGGNAPISRGAELAGNKVGSDWKNKFLLKQHEDRRWALRCLITSRVPSIKEPFIRIGLGCHPRLRRISVAKTPWQQDS